MIPSPATPAGRGLPVPGARRVVAYTFVFFAGMWLSKTVHPLYFDRHDYLVNFGLSYTAMAHASTTSAFSGRLADRRGRRAVLVACAALHAAGMARGIVRGSALAAVVSGLVARAGASSVCSGVRTWTLNNTTEDQRVGLVSRRESMTHAGTA